jgi:hypothetical protein
MAFEIRDLILSIESRGEGRARLVLMGCEGRTVQTLAEHELACARNTNPPVVPGSVPLGGLEDLRTALRELERQISDRIEGRQGKEAK